MNNTERDNLHVLVVDDSAVVREVMTAVLAQEQDIVVATASDPLIAMQKMRHQRPDVIILDLEMPRMDGLTFLRQIVRSDPIPVVVCSALTGAGTTLGLQAMEEGAVDVVTKPRLGVKEFLFESAVTLIDAVRAAHRSRRTLGRAGLRTPTPTPRRTADAALPAKPTSRLSRPSNRVIAVGASTGGTEALRVILEAMPPDVPGLLIVQHMPEGFTNAFAQRLNQTCRIEVKEAESGDRVVAGRALIAPGNRHALISAVAGEYIVDVVDGPLVSRHRPSVDVLFRSVAQSAGAKAIGVILTGMGSDGAEGLLKMKQSGAMTIAQDEASCVVFGMPKEAIERGAAGQIIGLGQIADCILRGVNEANRAAS